jgi:hypothetical protein
MGESVERAARILSKFLWMMILGFTPYSPGTVKRRASVSFSDSFECMVRITAVNYQWRFRGNFRCADFVSRWVCSDHVGSRIIVPYHPLQSQSAFVVDYGYFPKLLLYCYIDGRKLLDCFIQPLEKVRRIWLSSGLPSLSTIGGNLRRRRASECVSPEINFRDRYLYHER